MPDTQNADRTPARTPASADEVWVTCLSESCLDDVTLPPGGISTKPPPGVPVEKLQRIPRPDYLSYEGRDLRLDLIRGYFVFAMIIDHVRGASPLYFLTGGNRFFTSAAEGFILTSGLVSGLVYHRLIQRDGMSNSLLKVLQRMLTLYLLTVGVTLLFTPFSEITYLPWATGINFTDPLGFVVSVFTLHQTYYLIDVMLLYTVLFLVSPLAFVLLDRGKLWILLGGSWLLYVLYQFYPQYVTLPWPIEGNYLFSFSSWQVLFFSGLALGYVQERLPTLGTQGSRIALIGTGLATLVLIVLYFVIDTPTSVMPSDVAATSPVVADVRTWIDENLFSKADLRPGRLVASAVTFSFMFFGVTYFWKLFNRWTGRLLIPLGQHALYAYTAHIAVAGAIALFLKPFEIPSPGPQLMNASIQIASIALIWYITRRQFFSPNAKTRVYWNFSPVAIGLLIVVMLWRFPLPDHPGLVQAAAIDPSTNRTPRRFGTPVPKNVDPLKVAGQSSQATPQPSAQAAPVPKINTYTTLPGTDLLQSDYLSPTEGSVHERIFYSPELDRDMAYDIYLPPNYEGAQRRFPVVYLLHGLGGEREEWIAYDFINVLDQEIVNGSVPPMIVILPQGDQGYWTDHANDGPRWGQYVWRDLVTHIDATYRTLRSPNSRAIGGLSMGGWASLSLAFTRPHIFGIVAASSPSLHIDDSSLDFLGRGDEFNRKDPVYLAPFAQGIEHLRIWIDIGENDDIWLPRTTELHQALVDRGIDHIWQIFPGGHDYSYWREHAIDYVRFFGDAFNDQ